jgi:hypothetical protein
MKRECVPRGNTGLDQVSKQMSRVTTLLVHVSTSGPHTCHVALTHWSISTATSLDACHLAAPQATTSTDACYVAAYHEATSLFEIQQLDKWQHAMRPPQQPSATWRFLIGPPHHCGPHHTTRWLTSGPHLVPRGMYSLMPCHHTIYTRGLQVASYDWWDQVVR